MSKFWLILALSILQIAISYGEWHCALSVPSTTGKCCEFLFANGHWSYLNNSTRNLKNLEMWISTLRAEETRSRPTCPLSLPISRFCPGLMRYLRTFSAAFLSKTCPKWGPWRGPWEVSDSICRYFRNSESAFWNSPIRTPHPGSRPRFCAKFCHRRPCRAHPLRQASRASGSSTLENRTICDFYN